MKELIDYFNEKYTKKKEYICKDLKPIKLLDVDEYNDFKEKVGIYPLEVTYFPLFELPKIIKVNTLNYIFKLNEAEFKGTIHTYDKGISYGNNYIDITINKNKCVLCSYSSQIDSKNTDCSLTLYIDSPELPKLEYPKNKMDMYRAISFIGTISIQVQDSYLISLIMETFSLLVRNIENVDEMNFILDLGIIPSNIFSQKNSYFLTKKDNYYTVLDAIKKGKFIYIDSDNILPYWMINKEEKKIILKSFELDISAEASENGVLIGQMPR